MVHFKDRTTNGDIETKECISRVIEPTPTPIFSHCGMTLLGGKSFVDVYLIFTLKLRATHLLRSPYSEYQQFLYNTITDFLDKGWNYKKIADWLNDKGYKTP